MGRRAFREVLYANGPLLAGHVTSIDMRAEQKRMLEAAASYYTRQDRKKSDKGGLR